MPCRSSIFIAIFPSGEGMQGHHSFIQSAKSTIASVTCFIIAAILPAVLSRMRQAAA